jgi:hypothetical protein
MHLNALQPSVCRLIGWWALLPVAIPLSARRLNLPRTTVTQAWKDLLEFDINEHDVVVGIAASGTTPYVIGGLKTANEHGIATGCIVCNAGSPCCCRSTYARLKWLPAPSLLPAVPV